MRRAWVAAAFVIVALAVCVFGILYTNKATNEIKHDIEVLQEKSGEDAQVYLEQVRAKWEKYAHALSCYTRHSEIEDVTQCIEPLDAMLLEGQEGMFRIKCDDAINAIDHLRETEQPYIHNIL